MPLIKWYYTGMHVINACNTEIELRLFNKLKTIQHSKLCPFHRYSTFHLAILKSIVFSHTLKYPHDNVCYLIQLLQLSFQWHASVPIPTMKHSTHTVNVFIHTLVTNINPLRRARRIFKLCYKVTGDVSHLQLVFF